MTVVRVIVQGLLYKEVNVSLSPIRWVIGIQRQIKVIFIRMLHVC